MVRKEIWAHLLAYNLLRTVMAVAASENSVEPRAISFKGAKQALTAFAPKLEAGAAGAARGAGGCDAEGGGVPPGGQPTRALGAASAEKEAEARRSPDAAASRRQAGAEPGEVVLTDRAVSGGWGTPSGTAGHAAP